MARIRQSRPDSGLGFQAKVPKTFYLVPSSLGSGIERLRRLHSLDPSGVVSGSGLAKPFVSGLAIMSSGVMV